MTHPVCDGAEVPTLADLLPPRGSDPSEVLDAFTAWASDGGRPLYRHQEDAALALAAGDHVVLPRRRVPARAWWRWPAIVLALNDGRRAVWTAPIKALVAEKFFDLVDLFGAQQVGPRHGRRVDQSPTLRSWCARPRCWPTTRSPPGASSEFGFACLDEFHYYAEPRPGLGVADPPARAHGLPDAARLRDARRHDGDRQRISSERSAVGPVTEVTSVDRPTPLHSPVPDVLGVRQRRSKPSATGSAPCTWCTRTQANGHRAGTGAGQSLTVTTPRPTRGDRRPSHVGHAR